MWLALSLKYNFHVFDSFLLNLTIYYVYKAEKPSVCLSALFGWSVSRPWLHGSMSDLLDVIARRDSYVFWHDKGYF